jgi:hypothetical protein
MEFLEKLSPTCTLIYWFWSIYGVLDSEMGWKTDTAMWSLINYPLTNYFRDSLHYLQFIIVAEHLYTQFLGYRRPEHHSNRTFTFPLVTYWRPCLLQFIKNNTVLLCPSSFYRSQPPGRSRSSEAYSLEYLIS